MSYRSVLHNCKWKAGNIQTSKKLEKTWRAIAQESLSAEEKCKEMLLLNSFTQKNIQLI